MKLLGIDYGQKNIGLAIGNTDIKIAGPFDVLENKDKQFVIDSIKKVIEKEGIQKVIVGMPVTLEGKENKQVEIVKGFVDDLMMYVSIPVETEDERLTSSMAESLLKEQKSKKSQDDVAAMLILETYMERNY